MKKILYALTCAILVTMACGTSNIVPTLDPNNLQTAIISTALAAQHQTQAANVPATIPTDTPVSTNTPTATDAPLPIPVVETNTSAAALPASGNSLLFTFINVGQGDATLIQTPDGKIMLIDGGESDAGIVSQLQGLGVQRIDLMIATHPHSDHIGGLVQVLQSFPVAKVVTGGQPHTSSVYEHFLDGIAAAHAEYVEVKRGDVIALGGINFQVLNPVNNNNPDLNENSVVIQFKYGQTTFLMMGDSGADTEASLLSAGLPLKTDILKVGHHASTSGSTTAFLNAVQPKIALYSAGINNSYGHPAPQIIAALTAVGATIYGTDKIGTISIKVDLNGYTINTGQSAVSAVPVPPINTEAATPPLDQARWRLYRCPVRYPRGQMRPWMQRHLQMQVVPSRYTTSPAQVRPADLAPKQRTQAVWFRGLGKWEPAPHWAPGELR
jgi:competence protein ComEC